MSEDCEAKQGKFIDIQKYILNNTVKLPDGTPIFSARYYAGLIDEAKKEFPDYIIYMFKETLNSKGKKNLLISTQSMEHFIEWYTKYFGEQP